MTEKCSASCSDGSPCNSYPVTGEDKCRMHLGKTPDGSSHEGNGNALKHGVQADPTNLYDHLPDHQRDWVDNLTVRYLERGGMDPGDPRAERVRRACIHIIQSLRGEEHIFEDGLSEASFAGIDGDGNPHFEKDGHHLHKHILERDKEARMILKDLGLLNPPEQQQADAIQGLADAFAEMDDDVIDV